MENNNIKKGVIGIVSVAVLGGIGYYLAQKNSATTTPIITATNHYKDGTYSATGNYTSPAGGEEVSVGITLVNNIVTDATFTGKATNPGSIFNQGHFKEGFKEKVVGKSIDDISLTVVNGSSLTPKGFMDALAKIKAEAKNS